MDAVDPDSFDQSTAAVMSVPGIREVRELRIRWIGHALRVVDKGRTVGEGHDLAHHAETHLLAEVPRLLPANVHASPSGVYPEPS